MKVFCAAFTLLQFGFVIFWPKNICAKAAHKMLVKLTTANLYLHAESIIGERIGQMLSSRRRHANEHGRLLW